MRFAGERACSNGFRGKAGHSLLTAGIFVIKRCFLKSFFYDFIFKKSFFWLVLIDCFSLTK